jgi:hypothetical protein
VDPVGPSGETLLDYSVYDAIRGGFETIVFVIRRDIEDAFRTQVGSRFEKRADVRYAFQEIQDLPGGRTPPAGRAKPWGTGHATLAARQVLDGAGAPGGDGGVAVVNADDFYGRDAFAQLATFLKSDEASASRAALVAYRLDRTLSEHGTVSRGVCDVAAGGALRGVRELTKIARRDGRIVSIGPDGSESPLEGSTPVSLNTWGFGAGFLDVLAERFERFCEQRLEEPGAEFFLPFAVDELIAAGRVSVRALRTDGEWFGMTYREDRGRVAAAIARLVERGEYPRSLFA